MRGIFFTLLLINLAYFGFSFIGGEPETAPKPVEVINPYPNAERVKLLKEPRQQSPQESELEQSDPKDLADNSDESRAGPLCPTIGPFTSDEELESFLLKWNTDHSYVVKKVEVNHEKEFWLKSRSFDNIKDALSMIKMLERNGIESYLVKDQSGLNEVLIGVFEGKEGKSEAKQLLLKLQKLNVAAQLSEQAKVKEGYWVNIDQSVGFDSLKKDLEPIFSEFNNILLSQNSCE